MNAKDTLAGIGGILALAIFLVAVFAIVGILIFGMAWASAILLPWFSVLAWLTLGVVVFILLPLAIPKATRGFSSVALFVASYVFGATLWMEALLLTLVIWGVSAVLIGILLMGFGVVPIAMVATLTKGMWIPLIEITILIIITIACRVGAISLAKSLE